MSRRDEALLSLLLAQLRLPVMKRLWEEMAKEAEIKGWPGPKYLSVLCEQEIAERDRRRLSRHMKEAKLPKAKTLESYDFGTVAGVSKSKIIGLASGEVWIGEGMNVLIFGSSGVGKTHLAAAIGEKLIENGFTAIEKLDKYDCLILDDFGYVQKDELETSVLFELICERYERKSMVITCNQPFKEWDKIFLDKQMALAAVDRLVHHATILEIEAESYRKKQALTKKERKTG